MFNKYCCKCGGLFKKSYMKKITRTIIFNIETLYYCIHCKPKYDKILYGHFFKDNVKCNKNGKILRKKEE